MTTVQRADTNRPAEEIPQRSSVDPTAGIERSLPPFDRNVQSLTLSPGPAAVPAIPPNFLIRMAELAAEVLRLTQQLTEQDRTKSNEMKREYKSLIGHSAGSLRDKGSSGLILSGVSLVVHFAFLAFNAPEDRRMGEFLGGLFGPNGGVHGIVSGRYDATKAESDGRSATVQTELNTLSNAQHGELKNKILETLDHAIRSLQKASQAG